MLREILDRRLPQCLGLYLAGSWGFLEFLELRQPTPRPLAEIYRFRYNGAMWRNPIRALRQRSGLTQAALAEEGGTSQPTIAAYETGDRVPNLRTAERLAEAAGLEMTVDFGPPLTREDRRSLALHEALVVRLLDDPAPVIERARRTLARMQEAHGADIPLLDHWSTLLELPVEHLADILLDPHPFARDLRQCTPFAGILPQAERAEVYRRFAETERARQSRSVVR